MESQRLFAWREFDTFAAAVSVLAEELPRGHFDQQDRRALARTMLSAASGKIEVGAFTVQWEHSEGADGRMGDLLFTCS